MSQYQSAVDELHIAYSMLNQEFFDGALPEAAITIQTKGKRMAMGWCTTKEVWISDDQSVSLYEINISAEFLNVPFMETMNTLLHEMVHLYNNVNNVKDVSRNGTFHNTKFKAESERRGFYYDQPAHKKYGWTFSILTKEAEERIKALNINEEVFRISRKEQQEESKAKKNNSFKWECPSCHDKLRTTKLDVKPICGKCTQPTKKGLIKWDDIGFVFYEVQLTDEQLADLEEQLQQEEDENQLKMELEEIKNE